MRIAVISDSHHGLMHLERFVDYCRAEGIEQIFHLGDVLDDVKWLQKQLDIPIGAVAGNCDMFARHQREIRLTLGGKRFLMVHGDKQNVKFGYERLSYYAEEAHADIALFGHTHSPYVGYMGNVLLINPGALQTGKMCIIELSAGDVDPRIVDVDEWYAQRAE